MNKILFISDFTINNLSDLFKKSKLQNEYQIIEDTSGSVISNLLNLKYKKIDFCVIWTQPESIINELNNLSDTKGISLEDILIAVDNYCDLLKSTAKKASVIAIPTWTINPFKRGLGINDFSENGYARIILEMNHRLINKLSYENNVFILDANRWMNIVGSKSFSPKLWYRSKVPFYPEVFKLAFKEIVAVINAVKGRAKKIIFLDLDNTLWGGVVGDDGVENISLGGHDDKGEAFVDFQKNLLSFKKRGVLLAIVSKNTEEIALNVIQNHPSMVLKKEDFVAWRINWKDKAKNIIDLLNELNLGPESAVFIDDSPTERLRVQQALPEIFVPELPVNPLMYNNIIGNLDCFDSISETNEDLTKTLKYKQEGKRKNAMKEITNMSDWIKSLNIKIQVKFLNEINLKRAAQLLNKTNQMNLASRRILEKDFMKLSQNNFIEILTLNVEDRFGDYGLTGLLTLKIKDSVIEVQDFILSCRVMGRGVEQCLIFVVYNIALKYGVKEIFFPYVATKKNNPCLLFFKKSGLKFDSDINIFKWDMRNEYKITDTISIDFIDE